MAQNDPGLAERRERTKQLRSVGYLGCKRILSTLKDFEDLVRHDYVFDAQHARRTLQDLVPGADVPVDRERLLTEKMNRLIPIVSDVIWLSGVDTTMIIEKYETDLADLETKKVSRHYDLLDHYFDPDHRGDSRNYSYLTQALDRTIGVFEHVKKRRFSELFNPATYIAWVLRFPITVLEKSGLEGDDASSVMIKGYGWLIRVLMLLVLALLANKLGISNAWDKLIGFIAGRG
jgi:hypothetical protein